VINPLYAILLIPAACRRGAVLILVIESARCSNMLASGPEPSWRERHSVVDRYRSAHPHHRRLQHYLVTLTDLRRFHTSIFSASYIGHELEIGRLTPTFLRFYHALYQAMIGAMNVALVANNVGLLWVGCRGGHTVDRDDGRHLPHAGGDRGGMEVLHPGSVGIALAFFGTHPRLSRAQEVLGEGLRPWPGT